MIRITDGRTSFYQWDIGQSLSVEGDVTEVHIGLKGGNYFVVEPIEGIVAVYDELLQNAGLLHVYEYIKNEDEGHTVTEYRFQITARPRAEHYAYTPTESYSWEWWCNRAREYAELSKQYADGIPQTMTEWFNAHRDEFKGADGYTPVKGKDYFDGYTPQKDVDYFDGKDGHDYIITDSDYDAIAERTAERVPQYDDTEIREEIAAVNDSLTELSESVDGKVDASSYATTDRLGLHASDFEPREVSTEDRIDAIEEVLLELVLGGGIND